MLNYWLGFLGGILITLGALYFLGHYFFGPDGKELIISKEELEDRIARASKEGYVEGWKASEDDPIVALRHYAEVSDRLDSQT
jgi:hypothetical protein